MPCRAWRCRDLHCRSSLASVGPGPQRAAPRPPRPCALSFAEREPRLTPYPRERDRHALPSPPSRPRPRRGPDPGLPLSARPHGAPAERVVTLLGDSLTAGYGLKPAESLPRQLAKRLEDAAPPIRIVGAGVSGDTTADGLRRVDRDVPAQTDLCVLALGANDMMQLVPADRVKANLLSIIDRLQRRGVPVLVCGMRAPPWFGAYAWAFDAVYPEVSRASGAPLMPFLMEGVALHPAYVLPDRIHPNAVGVGRMADTLASHVRAALDALAASGPR